MRLVFSLALLLLTMAGHAADSPITVDGVVYRWSNGDNAYIVTGWDEEHPMSTIHLHPVVNDYDVVRIDDGAFTDNHDIEALIIDEGFTEVPPYAFSRCENLKTLVLPEGLTEVGDEAFSHCESLTTVYIPSTVLYIRPEAFQYCTGVTDVYFQVTDVAVLNGDFNWWDGQYRTSPNVAGGKEFNTVEHTVIHVPSGMRQTYVDCGKFEAWLGAIQEDDETAHTLAWIVNYGVVGRTYIVADVLTAVCVAGGDLYAKDDNGWIAPDVVATDELDYMKALGLNAARGGVYDQSNWVALQGVTAPESYKNYLINGGSITGTLISKVNPVIEVTSTPERGASTQYTPNTYIPASLMSRTQVAASGRVVAFVQPKPQEMARMDWTIYGDNSRFYMPAPDAEEQINVHGLKGGFVFADDLYPGVLPELVEGGYYPFSAILRAGVDAGLLSPARRKLAYWDPYTAGGISSWFTVYPLDMPDTPIETTVDHIETDTGEVHYFDLHGRYIGTSLVGVDRGVYITGDGRKVIK